MWALRVIRWDNLEFFDGGAEFCKYAHIGWSPTKADRYFKNFYFMAWHVDEREKVGIPSSHGMTIAANWSFDDKIWVYGVRVRLTF